MNRTETEPVATLHAEYPFDGRSVEGPVREHMHYPERVLQFGTGAFLRGFAEFFLDEANRSSDFAGRAVVVGSTGSGRSNALAEQDGLFTLCTRGLSGGEREDSCRVIASISRALSAADAWDEVLAVAASPNLELVLSNTTEVGIRLDTTDRADMAPPASFPGKLTAVLARRAEVFDHDPERGLVILPCELIEDNGTRLREIVLELARRWALPARTIEWIASANRFCNTLVDRIVTGFPDEKTYAELVDRLGYIDPMLTVAEPFRLWVIEGDEALARRIAYLAARPGVTVTGDISDYRERTVRLLNGAHTLVVPVSLLCGNGTVLETMSDDLTQAYVRQVMLQEIVPSLSSDRAAAESFAGEVLDRYANPYIRHELTSIALQHTSKLQTRVFPSLRRYVERFGHCPTRLTYGFAATIALKYEWLIGDPKGRIEDDSDEHWRRLLGHLTSLAAAAESVSQDTTLWEKPPGELPGFTAAVAEHLKRIEQRGPREALRAACSESTSEEV